MFEKTTFSTTFLSEEAIISSFIFLMNYAREIQTTKEILFALINCLTLEKHFIICIYVALFFFKGGLISVSIAPRKHTSNNYLKFLLEFSSPLKVILCLTFPEPKVPSYISWLQSRVVLKMFNNWYGIYINRDTSS